MKFAALARFALATWVSLLSVHVCAQTVDEVMDVTRSYFAALQRGDHARMAQMSSEAILKRAGGEAKLAELYRETYQSDYGRLLHAEVVQRVSWFASGSAKVYLVETTRQYDSFPEPQSIPYMYAVSASGAGGLKVLDLGCISVDWVDELAPGFRGSELAKDLVARHMINPGS